MVSKFDLSVQENLDGGSKSLPWIPREDGSSFLALDWSTILERKDARMYVRNLPSQVLYYSLKTLDKDNLLEVVPLLSNEQLLRILDYDAWTKDRLDSKKAFFWLSKFKTIEDLAFRYKSLDEEYQIALLQNHIKLFTKEELEELPEDLVSNCIPFIDDKLYYFINTDSKEVYDYIKNLILSATDMDVSYAYNLLAYSYYSPPNEQEQLLSQFRKARLEEDGFVSYEESQSIFAVSSSTIKALVKKYSSKDSSSSASSSSSSTSLAIDRGFDGSQKNFFSYVIQTAKKSPQDSSWSQTDEVSIKLRLLWLSNCLSSACIVDPSDIKGCLKLIEIIKSVCGLGLEYLASGNLELAISILQNENLKLVFQSGLYILHTFQEGVLQKLAQAGILEDKIEYIKKHIKEQKWAQVLNYIDSSLIDEFQKIDLSIKEISLIKACFNRFPMKQIKNNKNKDESVVFEPIGSVYDLKEAYKDITELLSSKNSNNQ